MPSRVVFVPVPFVLSSLAPCQQYNHDKCKDIFSSGKRNCLIHLLNVAVLSGIHVCNITHTLNASTETIMINNWKII